MALLYHKPRDNTRSFLYTGRARAVTFFQITPLNFLTSEKVTALASEKRLNIIDKRRLLFYN
jgi:hypothetical protein